MATHHGAVGRIHRIAPTRTVLRLTQGDMMMSVVLPRLVAASILVVLVGAVTYRLADTRYAGARYPLWAATVTVLVAAAAFTSVANTVHARSDRIQVAGIWRTRTFQPNEVAEFRTMAGPFHYRTGLDGNQLVVELVDGTVWKPSGFISCVTAGRTPGTAGAIAASANQFLTTTRTAETR